MKINKTIAGTGMFLILFYFLCSNFDLVINFAKTILTAMSPFLWAGFIVLLLNPIMQRQSKLYKSEKISAAITMLFFIVVIILTLSLIIPQVIVSATQLINLLKGYDYATIMSWIENHLNLDSKTLSFIEESLGDLSKNLIVWIQGAIPSLMNATVNAANNVINFITGVIITWYVLSEKSAVKKFIKRIVNAVKPLREHEGWFTVIKMSIEKFNMFLSGKLVDSLIVGVICFIFMSIVGMDYSVLVSIIIGITNVIPFFGPFIGAIPSLFILLIVNPLHALIFAIFILVLQQIDGNIIGPKILGESVGVSKIGVIFAIIVGGKLFGIIGMIIGVPALAVGWQLLSDRLNQIECKTAKEE